MSALSITLVIVQIVLSLILVAVVLFQHGSQQGLSGSIAGGAETFFGKNKGRTIDAQLKKWTTVVAVLFLLTSIALTFTIQNSTPPSSSNPPITADDGGINIPTDEGSVTFPEGAAPEGATDIAPSSTE